MDTPRKLAAILAADIAGYSRLMGLDEAGTAKALREHRAAIDPILTGHGGRIFKTTGDGVLVEFPSIVAAVESALAVQKLMAERNGDVPEDRRMLFRMGINLGDVLIEGDDILGDGVNVAARLEGIAQPGGVCVSEDAYRQTRGKIDAQFVDIGEQSLKNIGRPVRAYRVVFDGALTAAASTLPLPSKPSIAVLPFQNMSGDPEQEYFADGIVDNIITELSRFKDLFVIARNSSFTYKGRPADVRQVGRDLGVRYVLEGSVRKAANRVRITGQLIDVSTGAHLWADKYDAALEDIFELQDQVSASVIGQLAPKLEQAEIERARRKPTEILDAYDYHLRGLASYYQTTQHATKDTLTLFRKAIDLDPNFSSPYAWAAICYCLRKQNDWMADPNIETLHGVQLARRGAELGRDDGIVLVFSGFALAYLGGELETGATFIDRGLRLNPNWGTGWHCSGYVRMYLGEHDLAVEHQSRAMRLSPIDPLTFQMQQAVAIAHFFAGRYDDACFWAKKALMERPDFAPALRTLAMSLVIAGKVQEAEQVALRLKKTNPTYSLKNRMPLRRASDIAKYEECFRSIGLPE